MSNQHSTSRGTKRRRRVGPRGAANAAGRSRRSTLHEAPQASDPRVGALVAELATCLWYVKTRGLGRRWNDRNTDASGDGQRRTLDRIRRAAAALAAVGIEVIDPVNARYTHDGGRIMRPIHLVPIQGLRHEVVVETLCPIVAARGRIAQRAIVRVGFPVRKGEDR